jgi:histidine ammonia-lyase
VAEGRVVYGLTTGFGALAEVVIPGDRIAELQENLIRSHAAGVGEPLPDAEVRAIMLLRANVLALGHSGVRPHVIERILDLLNHGIHPVVPSGGAWARRGPGAAVPHRAGPHGGGGRAGGRGADAGGRCAGPGGAGAGALAAKEGLALNNGTQAMTGVGALALLAAERAVETAEVAGAMSLEAMKGTPDPFDEAIQRVRPSRGRRRARSGSGRCCGLGDPGVAQGGDPRVQDAYSLRCMPQVHGAARQALRYVREVLEVEANSATDNPLIFPDPRCRGPPTGRGRILSGGNFHGQPVAQVMDLLAMACADLASISERRLARLVDPASRGCPRSSPPTRAPTRGS